MTEEENAAATKAAPKPLRTYQSDVEEMLKHGEGSLATIAIAENDKRIRAGLSVEEPEKPVHTKLIIVISLSLIVLGAGTLAFLFLFRNIERDPVPLTEETPAIIVTDIEKDFDIKGLSRDRLLETFTDEQGQNESTLSSVVGFRLLEGKGETAEPVTASTFLKKLQTQAPDSLVRSFAPNFLFGLHILNVNHPFLIFKTGYYQNVYAGMLAWENTIIDDLGPLFIKPEVAVEAETSDQVLGRGKNFEDIVIKNRDTRALRNQSGKIVFLYSFPDKNTLIITTNADTLEKVATRLLAGKQVR
ncbi:MAG: hypothetical protein UX39_C0008G0017 [Candidatus Magasanikbacteria bacterium GW2011_GWA2_46_17]|uniref:Uncharacterized protein n=1 Tax=Candidatus Magasanikbacteria bacterium GW2011_GWA2_46_17 TaxID=1619042 RepID=A0A0G1P0X5_9BACT|nr:MAG: hypothetical protein UX39_C0008G0017 [Candidatus Magasanikbacteria bacterium GW2011_GWA2_46_17]